MAGGLGAGGCGSIGCGTQGPTAGSAVVAPVEGVPVIRMERDDDLIELLRAMPRWRNVPAQIGLHP